MKAAPANENARRQPGAGESQTALRADFTTLAAAINSEHEAAFGKAHEALEHARRAGELLVQVKASVGHGKFLAWIEVNCDCSIRQAQRYVLLAENWAAIESKYDTAAHLTLRDALRLIECSGITELQRAREWCTRADAFTADFRLEAQAWRRILDDPGATIAEVAWVHRKSCRAELDAQRIRYEALRELGRLLIELKALTKLNDSDLFAVLNDGSLIAACDERIAELEVVA